jgi:protein-L-isoaspartate(D-aspartate) O-methyltransferase
VLWLLLMDTNRLHTSKSILLAHLKKEIADTRVIEAIRRVPREKFVLDNNQNRAYENTPLPIGHGQTISQPSIIAIMIEALSLKKTDRVLELGTGSGYQAALLAEICAEVMSTERIPPLAHLARTRLDSMGYSNTTIVSAEKTLGCTEKAPFDAIIVSASAPRLPTNLIAQLNIGGRMVIPVGTRQIQDLLKITTTRDSYSIQTITQCSFVPLLGNGAWPDD